MRARKVVESFACYKGQVREDYLIIIKMDHVSWIIKSLHRPSGNEFNLIMFGLLKNEKF